MISIVTPSYILLFHTPIMLVGSYVADEVYTQAREREKR